MTKATTSGRESKIAKAGKRSGTPIWPAPLSPVHLAAREKGEQQFITDKPLTIENERTVIVLDQKTGRLVYKTKKIIITVDYLFDPTRGRVVYSPSFKGKDG